MKEIKIEIDLNTGETYIETSGFKGNECFIETKNLKNKLGNIKKEIKKEEFYKKTKTENKIKRGL